MTNRLLRKTPLNDNIMMMMMMMMMMFKIMNETMRDSDT